MPRPSLLAVIALLAACEAKKDGTQESMEAKHAAQVSWERMKECAQRTDVVAKQSGWVEGRDTITGWENHYNPRYARCYIAVTHLDNTRKPDPRAPLMHDELYDAFEGQLLATCTDIRTEFAPSYCTEPDSHGDCAACRSYINDRMERKQKQ